MSLVLLRRWWLTSLLLLINFSVFLVEAVNGVSIMNPTSLDLLRWGANFAPLTLTGDAWRLLSSMFLHVGLIHLAVNSWALYAWGVYAEFYYGRLYYLVMYLSAGLIGSLASVAHSQINLQAINAGNVPIISAGASGAIMGIGGALIIAAWKPKSDLHPDAALQLKPLLMIMAINFALGFSIVGIDNFAHLGGILSGALIALVFTWTEGASKAVRLLGRTGIFIVLAVGYSLILHQLEINSASLMPIRAGILSELATQP